MSRYLLDTNILVFLITDKINDDISFEVREILKDYANQLFTSSVSIIELQQLYRIGKVKFRKDIKVSEWISILENDFGVKILPYSKQHSETLINLLIVEKHNDPFDHAIISHAITDKLTLVSSDRKLEEYTKQKLKFTHNKR